MKILIMAGGSGTRLWPISRNRFPKQFVKINNNKHSLFQQTILRGLLITNIDDIYIVTNENYKFIILGELEELGYKLNINNLIIEPEAKNTLPAILAGVFYQDNKYENILVMPSDHVILNEKLFASIIKESIKLSNKYLVTFGVKPTNPNLGFGYISTNESILNGFIVEEFKEKPTLKLAKNYIEKGYFWNAGIFLFNINMFINEASIHSVNIYNAFFNSNNLDSAYSKIKEKISIDYGLLEKSNKIALVPIDVGWDDLGSFDSLYKLSEKDKNHNTINSENIILNSLRNYVYSDNNKLISLIGIEDTIIVENRDALLIAKRNDAQKVKELTKILEKRNDRRLNYSVKDYRPWGYYIILEEIEGLYKIKRIHVYKGKKLSLQSHKFRSEHWIIVRGVAKVTLDNEIKNVPSGESIFIKAGQKHRLENATNKELEIVEVQMGSYLGEDDITRFEDDFGRK